ncbi:hypothetical protein O181_018647 [Austropuccinia psidii MF-1]|uniref:O-methyltransferase C-terminal domain-containing protein n=1 Tax=Austropuccinia psidii MF-1 TaxID=1389203 RepID=A0A9Q3GTP7_9BASI|nr:hypothetical protein [Austropuccinia psidii MF-1]
MATTEYLTILLSKAPVSGTSIFSLAEVQKHFISSNPLPKTAPEERATGLYDKMYTLLDCHSSLNDAIVYTTRFLNTMSLSSARQLAMLISQAVDDIESDTQTQLPGAQATKLESPIVSPEDGLDITPKRRNAIRILQNATQELMATMLPTGLYHYNIVKSGLDLAAVITVCNAKIADVIHSFDPECSKGGVHINLLADRAGMDPVKLSQVLRFLAVKHIFHEPTENHWANNRASIALCTDSPNTVRSTISFFGSTILPPSLEELPRSLLDKDDNVAFSWSPCDAPVPRYFKADGDFFAYMSSQPEKMKVYEKCMSELGKITGASGKEYQGFDWNKLGPKGTLVDVGGGNGHVSYVLAKYLPNWTLIVQDQPAVVKEAQEQRRAMKDLSVKVEFEEADLFRAQPVHRVKGADVYFLRYILHDWPFEECIEILRNLRRAAKPTTRLLICDNQLELPNVPLEKRTTAGYYTSMVMLVAHNSHERNVIEFEEIFKKSGWNLVAVHPLKDYSDMVIYEGVVSANVQ